MEENVTKIKRDSIRPDAKTVSPKDPGVKEKKQTNEGAKQLQFINTKPQVAPPHKKHHKMSKGIVALLVFTGFFLGFVLGMVFINYRKEQEIAAVKQELATVIEEQSAINVTNIYVPERKIDNGKIAMNSYKTENFRIDNGFMAYFDEDGNKISHLGCDLSYHNDKIDWDELAKSGCEFVILRIGYRGYTEGGLVEDEKFKEYASEAKRVGLKLGVYFFTQSTTVEEAEEEAKYVLEILDGMELEYPIAYDTEYVNDDNARTNNVEISDELRSLMCIAFCEKIKSKGYYPIIYASENWMRRNMDLKMLSDYEFWAPQYLDENDFLFDFSIWQYTEDGNIPGVEGPVDLDISMVDYASFVPQMRQAYLTGGSITTDDSKGVITITTSREDDFIGSGADSDAGADDEVINFQDSSFDSMNMNDAIDADGHDDSVTITIN